MKISSNIIFLFIDCFKIYIKSSKINIFIDLDYKRSPSKIIIMESRLVLPGEIILQSAEGYMPGIGVIVRDGRIVSTVRGTVSQESQYISVKPITSIYSPHVGDIVVGRISQVLKQRWKVQIGCSVSADLRLSSIYLPDDQFRRRTTADERNMRQYFDVGDLLCAEVQQVNDGIIFLHTRQQHPRRLDNGIIIEVPARLVKRVQNHISSIEIDSFQFNTIFGLNGSIWLTPLNEAANFLIPRIRNCIILLATYGKPIFLGKNSITYENSVEDIFEKTKDTPINQIVTAETAKRLNFI